MVQQRSRASITRRVLLYAAAALILAAAITIAVIKYLQYSNSWYPKAAFLAWDLARAGLAPGYEFNPANDLKLEEVDISSYEDTLERLKGTQTWKGGNFAANVDDEGHLLLVVLHPISPEAEESGLSVLDPSASHHGTMLTLQRSEVESAYGPASEKDADQMTYYFDIRGEALIEVEFSLIPQETQQPTDRVQLLTVVFHQGGYEDGLRYLAKRDGGRIYQWPM